MLLPFLAVLLVQALANDCIYNFSLNSNIDGPTLSLTSNLFTNCTGNSSLGSFNYKNTSAGGILQNEGYYYLYTPPPNYSGLDNITLHNTNNTNNTSNINSTDLLYILINVWNPAVSLFIQNKNTSSLSPNYTSLGSFFTNETISVTRIIASDFVGVNIYLESPTNNYTIPIDNSTETMNIALSDLPPGNWLFAFNGYVKYPLGQSYNYSYLSPLFHLLHFPNNSNPTTSFPVNTITSSSSSYTTGGGPTLPPGDLIHAIYYTYFYMYLNDFIYIGDLQNYLNQQILTKSSTVYLNPSNVGVNNHNNTWSMNSTVYAYGSITWEVYVPTRDVNDDDKINSIISNALYLNSHNISILSISTYKINTDYSTTTSHPVGPGHHQPFNTRILYVVLAVGLGSSFSLAFVMALIGYRRRRELEIQRLMNSPSAPFMEYNEDEDEDEYEYEYEYQRKEKFLQLNFTDV